jgi:hypothetical protein
VRRISLALAMTLAAASVARAGEKEVLAHYDAYDAALKANNFAKADTEGEAAWREAEKTWGAGEQTATLAFNLVTLRLMGDRRAEAVEPARRLAEMVASGKAGAAASAKEAAAFKTLAEFSADKPDRGEAHALEQAFDSYSPTDFATRRIALLSWSYAANGYHGAQDWKDAYRTSAKAQEMLDKDPSAPLSLRATVSIVSAHSGFETNHIPEALAATERAVAAFPPQAKDKPLDPTLAILLVWDRQLQNAYAFENKKPFVQADPKLADPAWDDVRYPTAKTCTTAWILSPPSGPPSGPAPKGIGAVFEYTLADDGSVASVTEIDQAPGAAENPLAQQLRKQHAKPPSPECRGPLPFVSTTFLMPRLETKLR